MDDEAPEPGTDHWLWFKPKDKDRAFRLLVPDGWWASTFYCRKCEVQWAEYINDYLVTWSGKQPRCFNCGRWTRRS